MKKFVSRIFLFIFILALPSCCGALEKQSKALSIVSYAVRDSIDLGRFDLADEYSKELVRLALPPTPEERILINPFTDTK